jgi:hypothetical protein
MKLRPSLYLAVVALAALGIASSIMSTQAGSPRAGKVISGTVVVPNTGSGWTDIVRNNTAAEIVLTDFWANMTFAFYLEDAFGLRTWSSYDNKFILRSGLVVKPGEGLVVANPLLGAGQVWYSGYFQ